MNENLSFPDGRERFIKPPRAPLPKLPPVETLQPVYTGCGANAFGATNEPGSCLWCGKKLRRGKYRNADKLGDYGDNAFCGLRCGYSFGVTFATFGRRLEPKE